MACCLASGFLPKWGAVVPGCESRSLSDPRPGMRGSPAANASPLFGRRRGPASLRSDHGDRRARTGPGSPAGATKTPEPSRSWRRTRNVPGTHATEGPDPATRYSTRPSALRTCRTASSVIGRAPPASAGPAHDARSARMVARSVPRLLRRPPGLHAIRRTLHSIFLQNPRSARMRARLRSRLPTCLLSIAVRPQTRPSPRRQGAVG